MSTSDIFSIAGSALNAQDMRMAAIAANLANVDSVTRPGDDPYRAQEPVFEATQLDGSNYGGNADAGDDSDAAGGPDGPALGVQVVDTVQSNAAPTKTFEPSSPYADADGYVTGSNVRQVDEMVNMIDSSNAYSAAVAMMQQASRIDQQMISSFQVT
jgi:flagellar basal-body rod protein FlgC